MTLVFVIQSQGSMTNEDVTDLYNRVSVGTTVVVKN